MFRIKTTGPEETIALGACLARHVRVGDVLLLEGPLGVGKTTFVRGLARALGVTGAIRSPTYNLVHEYPTQPPLAHTDLYRLSTADEVATLGLDDLFSRSVVVLEWPERAPDLLPVDAVRIRFEFADGDSRAIEIEAGGPTATGFLQELEDDLAAFDV